MKRYDVFLSHSSADKPAVETLARKLLAEGITPFLDQWHLIPGEPWQDALEEALDQSRTYAVFLGPGGIRPWQNEEMRSALDDRTRNPTFRVIPVLLPGSFEPRKEDLPRFLRRLTWVDFRFGLNDEDAFRRLIAGIRGEAPGPNPGGGGRSEKPSLSYLYRSMAPSPEGFVHRREYDLVLEALCPPGGAVVTGTSIGITTALRGAGGFGKTALAQALCQNPRVHQTYPDGILWTTMGEEANADVRLSRILDLLRWWTDSEPPGFRDLQAASAKFRETLKGRRRVLVVLDDVWSPADVIPFQGIGNGSAILITTRDSQTLPTDTKRIEVDAMASPEAVSLLRSGLPDGLEKEFGILAARLGEWPLLLKLVNRQLRELVNEDGMAVGEALAETWQLLEAEGFSAFDRYNWEDRNAAAGRTISVSTQRLSPEEQERYLSLAGFPEDADVPLSVLERFWDLSQTVVQRFCNRLHHLSLLLRFERKDGTIRLHDVIRQVLMGRAGGDLSSLHKRLLEAFLPESGNWAELPKEETYLWRYLAYHLEGADCREMLQALLADFSFLQSKLAATDINSLVADYNPVQEVQGLRLIQGALRLSAHILAKDSDQLAPQLIGRLANQAGEEIQNLIGEAGDWRDRVWLRPRFASFTQPGGALIRTLEGHSDGVTTVAVLDDRCIISASRDGTLRLWDLETGQTLRTFQGHSDGVTAVAVLDDRRIVSASDDQTLRVWDLEVGQTLRTLEGHSNAVTTVAALDGRRAISAAYDGSLRVWDVETGNTLRTLVGHSAEVTAVAVLDSRRAISSSDDGTLRVWGLETGQILHSLEGHLDGVTAVAVVNSHCVVSASEDTTLRVWDLKTGKTLRTLKGDSWITSVAVLDDRRAVSACVNGTLWVWDLKTGQTLRILQSHSNWITAVAVLDDRCVVTASNDGTLRVWDLNTKEPFRLSKGHPARISAIAVLDGSRIVSAPAGGTTQFCDVESEQSLRPLKGHSDKVATVVALNDRLAISISDDYPLRVWDVETGQTLRILKGHSHKVTALAVLDNRRAISASDYTLRVWDVETGQTLRILKGHSARVTAMAVLDDRRVVSASEGAALWVWDLEAGRILQTFKGHSDRITAVAALDDRRAISSSDDQTLRVWDVKTGQTLRTLGGHSDRITAVAVLDSRRAVSSSDDQTLRVWDVETEETLRTLKGHLGRVTVVAMLDCCRAVSASNDRTLRVWDLERGRTLSKLTLEAEAILVAVSPDGRTVVAVDQAGRVHCLDLVEPESAPPGATGNSPAA